MNSAYGMFSATTTALLEITGLAAVAWSFGVSSAVPVASSAVAPTSDETPRLKRSAPSAALSSRTGTYTVAEVWPGANASLPPLPTKSVPAVAVSAVVA